MNAESWLSMQKTLNSSGLELLALKTNPIDLVWTEEDGRPPYKVIPTFKYDLEN